MDLSKNMVATMATSALAVFVKTPELSPIKTRLAADIGHSAAKRIYEKLLTETAAMMRQAQKAGITTYWAVGEQAGVNHARWQEFAAIYTGGGGLGERLNHVYATLQKKHKRVALAGSDCPTLTAARVQYALSRARGRVVIGPTKDGGFYLFAAAKKIPLTVWKNVVYSRADTLAQLLRRLSDSDKEYLPMLADIDDVRSLAAWQGRRHKIAVKSKSKNLKKSQKTAIKRQKSR